MDKKKQLREKMKDNLKQMNDDDYQTFSYELKKKLLRSKEWKEAKTIGITISTNREVDTRSIIEAGWEEKKRIVVPKCFPEKKELKFYQINSFQEVEDSFYSLKEPIITMTPFVEKSEIDLLIVPGLIFDEHGYRIGFGGGYYDRYLMDYANMTISLAFDFQLVDDLPKENFDIPIQKIISNT